MDLATLKTYLEKRIESLSICIDDPAYRNKHVIIGNKACIEELEFILKNFCDA